MNGLDTFKLLFAFITLLFLNRESFLLKNRKTCSKTMVEKTQQKKTISEIQSIMEKYQLDILRANRKFSPRNCKH